MARAVWLSVAIATLLSGACAIDWTVPKPADAGAGAGGGAGGEGGVPATSGKTSASNEASSTSGVPTQCDGAGDCSKCVTCAQSGACLAEVDVCLKNPDCMAIAQCALGCTARTQTCIDACIAKNPGGEKEFEPVLDCVVCKSCPEDCADLAKTSCI